MAHVARKPSAIVHMPANHRPANWWLLGTRVLVATNLRQYINEARVRASSRPIEIDHDLTIPQEAHAS